MLADETDVVVEEMELEELALPVDTGVVDDELELEELLELLLVEDDDVVEELELELLLVAFPRFTCKTVGGVLPVQNVKLPVAPANPMTKLSSNPSAYATLSPGLVGTVSVIVEASEQPVPLRAVSVVAVPLAKVCPVVESRSDTETESTVPAPNPVRINNEPDPTVKFAGNVGAMNSAVPLVTLTVWHIHGCEGGVATRSLGQLGKTP